MRIILFRVRAWEFRNMEGQMEAEVENEMDARVVDVTGFPSTCSGVYPSPKP